MKSIRGTASAGCGRSASSPPARPWEFTDMLNMPILRWGQPYTSLEKDDVIHFITGETLARVSQANTGLLGRDMRQAKRAREILADIPIPELIGMMKNAADLYLSATLPMGDGEQTPDDFARQQSAST